jgi:hypothetical protein
LADPLDYQDHLARFLENHDEGRCAAVFGKGRLASVGALLGALPGMRFYHQGELEGYRVHLPIQLRIGAEESIDRETASLFDKILRITKDDVFHKGKWNILPVAPEGDGTSGNLVAFEWRWKKSWKLIVANLANSASQGRIPFGDRPWAAKEYAFYDELHDVRYVRSREDLHNLGLFVRREASDAHLFDITRA